MKNLKGLNDKQVLENRKKYGTNTIKEVAPPTFMDRLKESFDDIWIKILVGIALLMIFLSFFGACKISEVIGIIIAVTLVTFIQTKQAMKSDEAYRKLKNKTKKEQVKIIRNGQTFLIDKEEIVVGDLIVLQSGDKIPADGYLLEGNIRVDNSVLNGETQECKKNAVEDNFEYISEEVISGDTIVDNHSLFSGTVICSGEGIMQVTKVGMETMMGKLAKEMDVEEIDTPLKIKLNKLAEVISKFGYIGSILVAIILMFRNVAQANSFSAYLNLGYMHIFKDFLTVIMTSVTIVVMAVPEGLPLMIAIVFKQNSEKMFKKNILVRKQNAIETAGSLNILFSDKTGTITKGQLEVVEFFDCDLKNSYKNSEKINDLVNKCICKNTSSMFDENGKIIGGNATDKALLQYVGQDISNKYENIEIEKLQTFNSANKYSCSQLKDITVYKGSPEKLLEKATKYINSNGNLVDFSFFINKEYINKKIDELANRSMRLLAFGYSTKPLVENTINDDLVIVGFVGIRDEVRQEAKIAIKEVQNAGIQVVMITGDKKETALAIAKESGLLTKDSDVVLSSEELNRKSDEEVKKILPNIRVIARALPTDKSRMVKLAQELNLVCGMTGDGVNDSPALKKADVGFAMGSGTDVAKDAGDIIIVDDNFKSIKNSILYGRTVYNNILKFIKFQLTINVTALSVTALVTALFNMPQPLGVTHMLWINLIMDGLGALALGSEPALERYMEEKPKSRTQSIVDKKMFAQIMSCSVWLILISLLFIKSSYISGLFRNSLAHMTGYFTMFVFAAVFNGFNVRSNTLNLFEGIEENKGFTKVMSCILLVQVILTFIGGKMFNCTPLTIKEWLVVLVFSISIIPFDLIRKVFTHSK